MTRKRNENNVQVVQMPVEDRDPRGPTGDVIEEQPIPFADTMDALEILRVKFHRLEGFAAAMPYHQGPWLTSFVNDCRGLLNELEQEMCE